MTAKDAVLEYLTKNGLRTGTHPENLATLRLHRWGVDTSPQHRVGRYRIDFAFPDVLVGIEVDGPHHHRPDVAHKDALRDCQLRRAGWLVLRVNTGDDFEEQLLRAVLVVSALREVAQ